MWSPDQLKRLGEWAAHMERLRMQYQRNAQVWKIISWVWFAISQTFTALALLSSLLQTGPPNGQCNIGPYKVCLTFFYFSIVMMFCAFIANNIVAYLKPDQQKSNCENVARGLSEFITYIGLLVDNTERGPFFAVATHLNQRFALIVKDAPSQFLWNRIHLDLEPLPAADSTSTPREQQWTAGFEAALSYELTRSSALPPATAVATRAVV